MFVLCYVEEKLQGFLSLLRKELLVCNLLICFLVSFAGNSEESQTSRD